jgi:hypothetical protein
MSKTRWLIAILLILVVASILAGALYRRSDGDAEPPLILFIHAPDFVTEPTVVVTGRVNPDARIELTRDATLLATVSSNTGFFETEITLVPGKNEIRVSAQKSERERVRAEREIEIVWEPKSPSAPTLNALPAIINVPQVTITGATHPNGRVQVVISPDTPAVPTNSGPTTQPLTHEIAGSQTIWANAEVEPVEQTETAANNGSFQAKIRLAEPGPYKVSAIAYNSKEVSSAYAEIRFVYDPEWYPAPTSVREPAPRIARKADIVLGHKQMSITVQVTLPKEDPNFRALLTNEITLDEFFEETINLQINGAHYVGEFDDIVPQIVIAEDQAIVTATTSPHRAARSYLPVFKGELLLSGNRGFPFSSPGDRLSVRTYDYTLESVGPPPTLFDKNTLTWVGTDSPEINDLESPMRRGLLTRQITLQLAYKPFASPRNLLRLVQVSPSNFLQYPGNTIPTFFLGLCHLIPMLWVIWLLVDSALKTTIETGLRTDLHLLSRALITLSLLGTFLTIFRGFAYFGWSLALLTGEYSKVVSIFEVAVSLAIVLMALLVQFFTSGTSRPWAIWLFRIAAGARNAAFICLLITSVWVLRPLPPYRFVPYLMTMILAFAYFFSRTAQVVKHGGMAPKRRNRLVVLAVLVTLNFPVAIILTTPEDERRWILSQAFSLLQSLLPYALAMGLLVVLKNVNTLHQRRTRHLVLTIGLILFSCFIVGPTANLFMIPIPFIISIWMYRNFLVHDFHNCGELDFVNSEVVSERRRLIDDVLSYETAQGFQANIEKLKEKVSSGDMTLQEFEDRKSQIEKYAYDKELASTHVNGLHAKRTVLGIGPNPEDWRNGKWCLRWGAAVIAPFLLAYLLLLLLRPTSFAESVFGFVFGLNQLLTFVADWLLAAFFFGYFFRYIRGNSGLEKGLRIACTVIICLVPTWITEVSSKTDLIGVFFLAGQTFLFFTVLGMAAFDYATFRNALRDQFRWRTFARFGNMPSFTAVVSVLITSIGVGLTSVITGQFTELFTTLLSAAFQQAPGPPR